MGYVERIYLIDKKHRHNSVKSDYLHVKRIEGKNYTFKVQYCDICKKYFCPISKYEKEYKGKIKDDIFLYKKDYIEDTSFITKDLNNICLNIDEVFYIEHMNHNIVERTLAYKNENFKAPYCKDCDAYGTTLQFYNNIKNGRKLNDSYYTFEKTSNDNMNIEFLIRINTFRCNARNHNLEEVIAVVNVYDKKHDLIKAIEARGFYCTNCKLYYIYEEEYKKIIRYGIPICPIYEEKKYFSQLGDFGNYNTESLLRQFGYNVNAQENLSLLERQKIIQLVYENGFMTKSEIMSHLSFLINSRKYLSNMENAVSKWREDLAFTSRLKNTTCRKVTVTAFRK